MLTLLTWAVRLALVAYLLCLPIAFIVFVVVAAREPAADQPGVGLAVVVALAVVPIVGFWAALRAFDNARAAKVRAAEDRMMVRRS